MKRFLLSTMLLFNFIPINASNNNDDDCEALCELLACLLNSASLIIDICDDSQQTTYTTYIPTTYQSQTEPANQMPCQQINLSHPPRTITQSFPKIGCCSCTNNTKKASCACLGLCGRKRYKEYNISTCKLCCCLHCFSHNGNSQGSACGLKPERSITLYKNDESSMV